MTQRVCSFHLISESVWGIHKVGQQEDQSIPVSSAAIVSWVTNQVTSHSEKS